MKVWLWATTAAGVAWVAAPWVSMAVTGTIDDRTRAAVREPVVPSPRRALDDLPGSPRPVLADERRVG